MPAATAAPESPEPAGASLAASASPLRTSGGREQAAVRAPRDQAGTTETPAAAPPPSTQGASTASAASGTSAAPAAEQTAAATQAASRFASAMAGRDGIRPAGQEPDAPAARSAETAGQPARVPAASDTSQLAGFTDEGGETPGDTLERSVPAALKDAAVSRAPETPASVSAPAAAAPVTRATPLAATALPAPLTDPQVEAENMSRLVESMRVQSRNGISEATVRLRPEHLGEVTISIRVDRGTVSALIHAESPAVQQWLEAQEERLRSSMSDQGLNLEKFVVQRDRQQERRDARQQPPPRYRPARDQEHQFEVTA
jgi:flagellar hook-length control protein FliK